MKIYIQDDFDITEAWNNIFDHINVEMSKTLGNSYESSIIDSCKSFVNEMSVQKKIFELNSTITKLKGANIIVLENGNSNLIISSVISHSFLSGIKLPFIGHLLDMIYSVSGAGKEKKQLQDMQKEYQKNTLGKDCSQEDMNYIATYGEDAPGVNQDCLGEDSNTGEDGTGSGEGGEGGDGEGEGGGGDGTGTRPEDPDANARWDPLALDLNHNGKIDTTALSAGEVFFDIDENDGGIREHMGWLGEGDGFLVQDLNNNGNIDGISELFGNFTTNAFDDLKARIDSNNDGIIDANDDLFHTLQVWIDKNGNGTTEEGEFHSLESLGITSIDTNKTLHTIWDGTNNIVNSTSTYTQDGEQQLAGGMNFEVDQTVTKSSGTIYVTDLSQPILRGFGDVKDSIVVMNENPDFRSLIKEMAAGIQ